MIITLDLKSLFKNADSLNYSIDNDNKIIINNINLNNNNNNNNINLTYYKDIYLSFVDNKYINNKDCLLLKNISENIDLYDIYNLNVKKNDGLNRGSLNYYTNVFFCKYIILKNIDKNILIKLNDIFELSEKEIFNILNDNILREKISIYISFIFFNVKMYNIYFKLKNNNNLLLGKFIRLSRIISYFSDNNDLNNIFLLNSSILLNIFNLVKIEDKFNDNYIFYLLHKDFNDLYLFNENNIILRKANIIRYLNYKFNLDNKSIINNLIIEINKNIKLITIDESIKYNFIIENLKKIRNNYSDFNNNDILISEDFYNGLVVLLKKKTLIKNFLLKTNNNFYIKINNNNDDEDLDFNFMYHLKNKHVRLDIGFFILIFLDKRELKMISLDFNLENIDEINIDWSIKYKNYIIIKDNFWDYFKNISKIKLYKFKNKYINLVLQEHGHYTRKNIRSKKDITFIQKNKDTLDNLYINIKKYNYILNKKNIIILKKLINKANLNDYNNFKHIYEEIEIYYLNNKFLSMISNNLLFNKYELNYNYYDYDFKCSYEDNLIVFSKKITINFISNLVINFNLLSYLKKMYSNEIFINIILDLNLNNEDDNIDLININLIINNINFVLNKIKEFNFSKDLFNDLENLDNIYWESNYIIILHINNLKSIIRNLNKLNSKSQKSLINLIYFLKTNNNSIINDIYTEWKIIYLEKKKETSLTFIIKNLNKMIEFFKLFIKIYQKNNKIINDLNKIKTIDTINHNNIDVALMFDFRSRIYYQQNNSSWISNKILRHIYYAEFKEKKNIYYYLDLYKKFILNNKKAIYYELFNNKDIIFDYLTKLNLDNKKIINLKCYLDNIKIYNYTEEFKILIYFKELYIFLDSIFWILFKIGYNYKNKNELINFDYRSILKSGYDFLINYNNDFNSFSILNSIDLNNILECLDDLKKNKNIYKFLENKIFIGLDSTCNGYTQLLYMFKNPEPLDFKDYLKSLNLIKVDYYNDFYSITVNQIYSNLINNLNNMDNEKINQYILKNKIDKTIIIKIKDLIEKEKDNMFNRDNFKKIIMTIAYSSKEFNWMQQLENNFSNIQNYKKLNDLESRFLFYIILVSIKYILRSKDNKKSIIDEEIIDILSKYISNNYNNILDIYLSIDDFLTDLNYNIIDEQRLSIVYKEKNRLTKKLTYSVFNTNETFDSRKFKLALIPNCAHSYDAAIMRYIINNINIPLLNVHDCFITNFFNLSFLISYYHLAFLHIHKNNIFYYNLKIKFKNENEINLLDIIKESDYNKYEIIVKKLNIKYEEENLEANYILKI